AGTFFHQAQQDMLGANIFMIEPLGLLISELHYLMASVGKAFIHKGALYTRLREIAHRQSTDKLLYLPFDLVGLIPQLCSHFTILAISSRYFFCLEPFELGI